MTVRQLGRAWAAVAAFFFLCLLCARTHCLVSPPVGAWLQSCTVSLAVEPSSDGHSALLVASSLSALLRLVGEAIVCLWFGRMDGWLDGFMDEWADGGRLNEWSGVWRLRLQPVG